MTNQQQLLQATERGGIVTASELLRRGIPFLDSPRGLC
jgi:hypothetical protein